jgi:selenocysteine-specific translation elongation factor
MPEHKPIAKIQSDIRELKNDLKEMKLLIAEIVQSMKKDELIAQLQEELASLTEEAEKEKRTGWIFS